MYRAVFADGSSSTCGTAGRRWPRRSTRFSGRGRRRGLRALLPTGSTDLYRVEMPHFIDTNFDSSLDLVRPWRAGAASRAPGRVPPPRAGWWPPSSTTSGCGGSSPSSRCTPALAPYEALALYAVITYMDTVEGVFVPEGGMHAMATGLADARSKAGATFRYDVAVSRDPARRHRRRSPGSSWTAASDVVADAVVCNADLPVAYRTLLGGVDAPRAARRGTLLPGCVLWVAGVHGPRRRARAPQPPLRRATGTGPSVPLIGDGQLMPDPSMLVTVPQLRRSRRWRRPGARRLYVLEPVPNLDGRVDWTSRARRGGAARCADASPRLGYPVDVEIERFYDPLDWEAHGDGARHAVLAGPHVPPDRAVPAGQRRPPGPRSRVHRLGDRAGRGRPDGAGLGPAGRRPGRQYATRSAGRGDARDARGELRAVPAAQPAPRHDLLLVDDASCRR